MLHLFSIAPPPVTPSLAPNLPLHFSPLIQIAQHKPPVDAQKAAKIVKHHPAPKLSIMICRAARPAAASEQRAIFMLACAVEGTKGWRSVIKVLSCYDKVRYPSNRS